MIDIDINNQIMLGIAAFVILLLLGNVLYIMFKDNKKDKEEIDELMNSMKERKKQQTVVKQQKNTKQEQSVESNLESVNMVKESEELIEEPATVISSQKEFPTSVEVVEDEKVEFSEKKSEIEEMLEKMQKDLEAKTEDIVENFEKEQEEKSIISYQELLKTMKENNANTTKRQPTAAPIEIKQSDITPIEIEQFNNPIEELVAQEPTKEVPTSVKKFKNTEFISPIYGKMEDHSEYPKVPVFHSKETVESDFSSAQNEIVEDVIEEFDRKLEGHNINDYLEDFDFHRNIKIDSLEQTLDMPPISQEIKENEEFLQALKEFRKNLE